MSKLLRIRRRDNIILFSLNVIYIFILGLFEGWIDMHYVYFTLISLIYIASVITIKDNDIKFFNAPFILIILTWLAELLHLPLLIQVSGILVTIFFFYVIVLLVNRVASSKTVGALEFLESVNVYLLLGIAGSILFRIVYLYEPKAFMHPGESLSHRSDFIYFSFITMTTLGYGDITPINPLARSLSIFFSVAGQLYLTMIIAMLVGKYIGQKTEKELKH